MGNWWLAASSPQHPHSCITSHAEVFFDETSNHPGDSVPLQPRFGTLWLLACPKTKITFERGEISDHGWDSEKYDGTADGDWENCVRFQGAYSEGLRRHYPMYDVSCIFFSKCLSFHITWVDTFCTDYMYTYIWSNFIQYQSAHFSSLFPFRFRQVC